MYVRIFFILDAKAICYEPSLLARFRPVQKLVLPAWLHLKPLIRRFLAKIDQRAHIDLDQNEAGIGHIQVDAGGIIEADGEVIL